MKPTNTQRRFAIGYKNKKKKNHKKTLFGQNRRNTMPNKIDSKQIPIKLEMIIVKEQIKKNSTEFFF
jgi:hypothetical protein